MVLAEHLGGAVMWPSLPPTPFLAFEAPLVRDEPPNQLAVGVIDCTRSTSARSASGIVFFAQGGGRGSLVSGYFLRRQRFHQRLSCRE